MCARTGWTWDYVWNELDVDRIEAMERQWMQEPPVGLLVGAFLGFKRKDPPKSVKKARAAQDLLRMFPGGRIGT